MRLVELLNRAFVFLCLLGFAEIVSAQSLSLGVGFKAGTGFPGSGTVDGLTELHYTNPVLGYSGSVTPRSFHLEGEIPFSVKLWDLTDRLALATGGSLGFGLGNLSLGTYDPNTEKNLKVDWLRLGLSLRPEVLLLWNMPFSETTQGRVVLSVGPYFKGTLVNSVSSNTNWLTGNKVVTDDAREWLSWGGHAAFRYQMSFEKGTWFSGSLSWDQDWGVAVPGLDAKDSFGSLSLGVGVSWDF